MAAEILAEQAGRLADIANELAAGARLLAEQAATVGADPAAGSAGPFWYLFTIFVLAIFVGYFVVWRVTPALHSPLRR
jgi:NAD(P) transhydrogenase subunit alpha